MRESWLVAGVLLLFSASFVGHSAAATNNGENAVKKTSVAKTKKTTSTAPRKTAKKTKGSKAKGVVKAAATAGAVAAVSGLSLYSTAALVFDAEEGTALYSKNSDTPAPIASITKLMTAMVVLDARQPMDELLSIDYDDVDTLRNSSSRLRVGTVLTRGEMLRLALMSSENRAASSLARHFPGGTKAFVDAMNRKASSLGMFHTRFVDSTGLRTENVSTARDLAKMVTASYEYPLIREYSTTPSYDLALNDQSRHLAFNNTNALVKSKDWEIGVSKTGYIREAGRCLVMHATIASKAMVIVLLDSWGKNSRIGDANRIKQWVENGHGGKVAKSVNAARDA